MSRAVVHVLGLSCALRVFLQVLQFSYFVKYQHLDLSCGLMVDRMVAAEGAFKIPLTHTHSDLCPSQFSHRLQVKMTNTPGVFLSGVYRYTCM